MALSVARRTAPEDYFWTEVSLDEPNRRFLAAAARVIAEARGDVPYGIDMTGLLFDPETGQLTQIPADGTGLTCATFILTVFKSYGFHLVNEESWPARPSDADWQTRIVARLRTTGASEAHVSAMQAEIGAKRFRPEEVVAAAQVSSDHWPADFEDVKALAAAIVEQVQAARQQN
jgi:hypothetical protein